MNKYYKRIGVLAAMLLCGCVASELIAQETVGARFRKVIAEIDAECKQDKLGPYLDRSDPEYRRKVAITSCDILKLEPRDWRTEKLVRTEGQLYPTPERWLATPEGRFAHSIKLPPPHDRPKIAVKPGDSGEEYYQSLCRDEAGEHAFRTVNGIDGVLQARPWIPRSSGYVGVVFWTTEKGALNERSQEYLVQPYDGRFQWLEATLDGAESAKLGKKFRVFYRSISDAPKLDFQTRKDGNFRTIPYLVATRLTDASSAKYAYTWRGIWLGQGIDHGIEGSELIVYQIEPFEVLGFQRRFYRHIPHPTISDPKMTASSPCKRMNEMETPSRFIQKIIVPAAKE